VHEVEVASGTLDADGGAEITVPVGCDEVVLRVFGTDYNIVSGGPISATGADGARVRLRALGYFPFPEQDVTLGREHEESLFHRAVLGFQLDHDLPGTGELDAHTERALERAVP
jgi:hypothetical protein